MKTLPNEELYFTKDKGYMLKIVLQYGVQFSMKQLNDMGWKMIERLAIYL